MGKPEIPADVRKQAWAIYLKRCDEVSRLAAEFEEEEVIDLLALAILAAKAEEREACAVAAERVGNFGDFRREELSADFGQPRFDMMHQIAAAIRKRGEA